ncbi:MAG: hypothetical protein V1773_03430 [bacterium]
MAQKLESYYLEAARIGGLKAKVRLAILSNISSANAHDKPDTPEDIHKMEIAMREIKKEFK